MKSCQVTRIGVLILLILVHQVVGKAGRCSRMDSGTKEALERVYEREFMGCMPRSRDAIVAMRRLNWLLPSGESNVIQMARNRKSALKSLNSMGMRKRQKNMFMKGLEMAGKSLGKSGRLTTDTGCIVSLEPDYVAMLLASAKSSRGFNRLLKKACRKRNRNRIGGSGRFSGDMLLLINTIFCILALLLFALLLGLFGGFAIPLIVLIPIFKAIIAAIFVVLPCPSVPARMIIDPAA